MINKLNFLGLIPNKNSSFKNIVKTWLYSYLFIFIIIFLKIIILNLNMNDLMIMAQNMSLSNTIFYGFFCFLQELLFRGIIQRYLIRKTNNKYISFLITNIAFVLCHVGYSINVKIGAIVIGFICSYITDRDDNIYNSIFIHWIIGGIGYIFI